MERLLWVCVAGALGTGVRYLVGIWALERFGAALPYGTLLVNVAGCFLMGLLMQLGLHLTTFSLELRLALTTGFLGGLTTYSSFNYETTEFLRAGAIRAAVVNFGLTTAACLLAGVAGWAAARAVLEP